MPRDSELREGLQAIAHAIKLLGNADAATPMGGLEALGLTIRESFSEVAQAIEELAEAVQAVAAAIENR